jgi:L,D-peptidoglycan transpeptidase YkuD (ErfK/YbiS/YcfS/YnhG family)
VKKLGTSHARIGYGGLVWGSQRQQGSGTTPMGTFGLTDSFGKHWRQTGWNLDYRRIRSGDYWVLDNQSEHYNRYRNKSQGGFRWWLSGGHRDSSELLTDYIEQYEMAIVINFNTTRQVRHRGGAIFLHINGSGATAGCVSVPRSTMKSLMAHVDSWKHPVIAIGR